MPISPDRILYEDQWYVAVNKLSQELVVKGSGKVDKLPLLDFLRPQFPGIRPLGRLDFETSGVVVFARTKDALERVVESDFKGWTKTYQALAAGIFPKDVGEIRVPLPSRVSGEKVPALTRYRVLELFHGCTLVECTIETGRHHQIRRHLAMIKHPLLLDEVYGDKKTNSSFKRAFHYRRFFLHAATVAFTHPFTGEKIEITAPRPKVFEDALTKLRKA